jgi:hypothetical protein
LGEGEDIGAQFSSPLVFELLHAQVRIFDFRFQPLLILNDGNPNPFSSDYNALSADGQHGHSDPSSFNVNLDAIM